MPVTPTQLNSDRAHADSESYSDAPVLDAPPKKIAKKSFIRSSQVHIGLADVKFANMFSEGIKQF